MSFFKMLAFVVLLYFCDFLVLDIPPLDVIFIFKIQTYTLLAYIIYESFAWSKND